jgi:ABC-type branched-subunit amino acid transport system ATPase component
VDLEVPPATIVGLVGPNGAGKSTLFGVLSGLLRPTNGRVLLEGEDVTQTKPQFRAERGLARTFQHPELFTGLTVRNHLRLAYRAKKERQRIWSDLFTLGSLRPADREENETVNGLIKLLDLNRVADLPALGLPLGIARLVELGRALAASPTVLLLDEPSSGLDTAGTEQFEVTLRRVATERGISVLLVEHDVELVMRLSEQIYVLDFGALIATGTPDEIRANAAVRAAYLGEEVSGDAESQSEPNLTTDIDTISEATLGEASRSIHENIDERGSAPPGLVVENLSVRYGEAVALHGISFTVAAGETLAILGANGAGKSSLARAVSGLVPPAGGRITFAGMETDSWPPYRIRRAGLVLLPESRGVFRNLSVIDNLRMAANTIERRQDRQKGVELALEIFPALAARRHQKARVLSGGEQQMLSLARALATSPKLLVADEMSLGLAPKMVDLVFEGLARAREAGVTVIMIEQYVHRALAFADQCLVLQRGAVVWKGAAATAGNELLRHYLGEGLTAAS